MSFAISTQHEQQFVAPPIAPPMSPKSHGQQPPMSFSRSLGQIEKQQQQQSPPASLTPSPAVCRPLPIVWTAMHVKIYNIYTPIRKTRRKKRFEVYECKVCMNECMHECITHDTHCTHPWEPFHRLYCLPHFQCPVPQLVLIETALVQANTSDLVHLMTQLPA